MLPPRGGGGSRSPREEATKTNQAPGAGAGTHRKMALLASPLGQQSGLALAAPVTSKNKLKARAPPGPEAPVPPRELLSLGQTEALVAARLVHDVEVNPGPHTRGRMARGEQRARRRRIRRGDRRRELRRIKRREGVTAGPGGRAVREIGEGVRK